MPETDASVVVVGGGPVGLVTALFARRAGLDVVVIEPRQAPIDKPCGQGIMPAGAAILDELGVQPDGATINGITYVDGERRASATFRRGAGLGVRRTELHRALSHAAAEAGVRVIRDTATSFTQDLTSATVGLRSGEKVRGAYLIGADGVHSRVRGVVTGRVLAPRLLRRFGFVTHVDRSVTTGDVEVHWAQSGEVYLTPLGGGETGVAVLTRFGTGPRDVLAELPQLRGLVGRDADFGGAGPFLQVPARHVRGRMLLVGDAAGYVDALTGEGLTVGFAQARAAVAAIAAGDAGRYERDWWRASAVPLGLAGGLVAATSAAPVRRVIVPAAQRLPGVFGSLVSVVAGAGIGRESLTDQSGVPGAGQSPRPARRGPGAQGRQPARRVTTGARRTARAEMSAASSGTPMTTTASRP